MHVFQRPANLLLDLSPEFKRPGDICERLQGTTGPGFTISMAKKPTKAGKYTLVVRDLSDQHNFHLKGPGVNVKTGVATKGTKTFTIKVVKGKYSFVCDPHASTMKGSFTIR